MKCFNSCEVRCHVSQPKTLPLLNPPLCRVGLFTKSQKHKKKSKLKPPVHTKVGFSTMAQTDTGLMDIATLRVNRPRGPIQ